MSKISTRELLSCAWGDDVVYVVGSVDLAKVYHRGNCKEILFAKERYHSMFVERARSLSLEECSLCFGQTEG